MIINLMETNPIYLLIGGVIAILGLGLAIYGIATYLKNKNRVSTRLDQFVTAEAQPTPEAQERLIISREISGSLFSRTIGRWVNAVLNFLGRFTPQKMALDLEHKLTIADHPGHLHAREFFAIKFLVLLGGIGLAYWINRDLQNINLTSLLFGAAVVAMGFLLPDVWLNGKVRAKQDEIARGLPDALDMLSVCASAGLGFDQSLQKISEYWETALGREIKRATQEMEMGLSRAVALRNMSDRLDVDDLTRFTAVLIQAERIGMSYAEVLHSQAGQMRIMRQLRARELANKLPGKIIVPVALLIFPAIIAVILGPAVPTILDALTGL